MRAGWNVKRRMASSGEELPLPHPLTQHVARLAGGTEIRVQMGARVGLGVDGAASNEAADMISEAHMCWHVHRALAGSATQPRPEGHGESGADVITAEQVLHWGSSSGARMLGFADA